MKVEVIGEYGYEQAVLGFSLSYNSTIERTKQILPKYAFGVPGENKFLEQMVIYLDVTAPRYWWQEADTYRVGSSKQSESTMHTLMKRRLEQEDFEDKIHGYSLHYLNELANSYRLKQTADEKRGVFLTIKSNLPEGFLQRRIWMINYKTMQNIIVQRLNHRLPQWRYFIETILNNVDHPEFLYKGQKHE